MERKEEERVSSKKILVFENKNNTIRICTILSQHRGHRLSESWNLQRFPERGDSKLYVNLTVSLYPREKCYIFPRQQRINRSMLPCILFFSLILEIFHFHGTRYGGFLAEKVLATLWKLVGSSANPLKFPSISRRISRNSMDLRPVSRISRDSSRFLGSLEVPLIS